MFAHFLTDVVGVLGKLSLCMQREKCVVSDVMMKVHITSYVLQKYKTRAEPVLRAFMPGTTMHGHELSAASKLAFASAQVVTIDKLNACLQRRVPPHSCV